MVKYRQYYDEWEKLYREGHSVWAIAKKYGSNHSTVWEALKRKGIDFRPVKEHLANKEYKKKHREWKELYEQGLSGSVIAEKYGVHNTTIYRALKKMGLDTSDYNTTGHRKLQLDENAFDVIDASEKAYWLGFLMADGNITKHTLQVGVKKNDEVHLYKMLKFLGSDQQPKHWSHKDFMHLRITSKHLVRGLIDKGCVPKKSLIAKYPTEDKMPVRYNRHFIRGYFDGDGCIMKQKRWNTATFSIASGSIEMLKDIEQAIGGIVERFSWESNKKQTGYQIRTSKRDNLVSLYHYLYDNATIYLDRKKAKFEEVLGIE